MSAVRLLAAAALARTADAGAGVVIVLASIRQFGGPAQGSVVLAVLLVPHLVAGPFVGLVTDRARRPRLVHSAFVAGFGTAIGGILSLLGHVPQPIVLVLALVAGCCGSMIFGGLSSRLDDVVAEPDRGRFRGLDAATYNVADIFGPASGAALAVSVGVPAAAAVIVAACLSAAVLLLTVRPLAGPAIPDDTAPATTAAAAADCTHRDEAAAAGGPAASSGGAAVDRTHGDEAVAAGGPATRSGGAAADRTCGDEAVTAGGPATWSGGAAVDRTHGDEAVAAGGPATASGGAAAAWAPETGPAPGGAAAAAALRTRADPGGAAAAAAPGTGDTGTGAADGVGGARRISAEDGTAGAEPGSAVDTAVAGAGAARPGAGGRGSFAEDFRAGFRAIVVSRPLFAVTVATCVATFGNGMMPAIAVLLGVAHGHPGGGGLLVTAVGVGALAGSLLMAKRPLTVPPHRVVLACLAVTGIGLAAVPLVSSWVGVVALFAVVGLFEGPLFTSVLQVRANEAPARVRTQVFTLGAGVKLTAAAVGAAVFAVVVGSPLWVLVVGLGGTQLVAAAVGLGLLAVRRRAA